MTTDVLCETCGGSFVVDGGGFCPECVPAHMPGACNVCADPMTPDPDAGLCDDCRVLLVEVPTDLGALLAHSRHARAESEAQEAECRANEARNLAREISAMFYTEILADGERVTLEDLEISRAVSSGYAYGYQVCRDGECRVFLGVEDFAGAVEAVRRGPEPKPPTRYDEMLEDLLIAQDEHTQGRYDTAQMRVQTVIAQALVDIAASLARR